MPKQRNPKKILKRNKYDVDKSTIGRDDPRLTKRTSNREKKWGTTDENEKGRKCGSTLVCIITEWKAGER